MIRLPREARDKRRRRTQKWPVFLQESVVLKTLPVLVEQYEPFWGALPEFLVTVATDINWTEEQPCFDGIARALAKFYAVQPPPAAAARPRQQDAPGGGGGGAADIAAAAAAGGGGAAGTGAAVDDAEAARLEHRAKHVIYPALRSCLLRNRAYKKTQLSFLSAFPMFVPSLSWQNVRFYITMAQKVVRPIH
jgi:hypothetical protein